MPDDQEQKGFKITVEGDGLNLNRAITAEQAREVLNIIMGGAPPSPGSVRMPGIHEHGGVKRAGGTRMSIREFLNDVQAINWASKIAAIGVYLHDQEGIAEFSRDDIRARFRQAGEGQPGNYHRDFLVAITNGWVAEDKPGRHYVTNTGRQAVESRFAGEVKRTSQTSRRKARGPSAESDAES